jgi:uncharacterized membrane protein YqiK
VYCFHFEAAFFFCKLGLTPYKQFKSALGYASLKASDCRATTTSKQEQVTAREVRVSSTSRSERGKASAKRDSKAKGETGSKQAIQRKRKAQAFELNARSVLRNLAHIFRMQPTSKVTSKKKMGFAKKEATPAAAAAVNWLRLH